MPSKVDNFSIADNGNGNSLHLTWRKNTETDLAGYQIGVGKTSGIYDSIITTIDTSVIVGGLSNGIKYYFGISTFDNDGNRSFILEKSFIPRIIPLSPSGLTDYPSMHKIMINWYANKENDLLGYNIIGK